MKRFLAVSILGVLALACGDPPPDPGEEHEWTTIARAEFPTTLDLHTNVITRSCAPAGGVCHNNKEYPDLHTVGNFISIADKPCNQDEEDPTQIFDGCEPPADSIYVPNMDFLAKIALWGPEEYDEFTGEGYRRIVLTEPAPSNILDGYAEVQRDGGLFLSLPNNIQLSVGQTEGRINDVWYLPHQTYLALWQVEGGDPNGNGILGGDLGWRQVRRGSPDLSYFIGRITEQVPGSRMPLANQPLSNPEYVALFCWVEGLAKNPYPESTIDYAGCDYAKRPEDFAIE